MCLTWTTTLNVAAAAFLLLQITLTVTSTHGFSTGSSFLCERKVTGGGMCGRNQFTSSGLRDKSGLHTNGKQRTSNTAFFLEGRGEYYGESGSSFMVREFSLYEQLEEIVKLSAQPLPERPDGIVCIAKYTSATRGDCRSTEAQYERMARDNPATVFLRCFEEYESADLLFGQAKVQSMPTFDVFYGGNRVARVEGPDYTQLEELIQYYQFQNSNLDLFSEQADNERRLRWGDRKKGDFTKTPRTTARFIPGYDWDKDRGFFDDLADKAQEDFEKMFENWVPDVEE